MLIKVLGSGCSNCQKLEENTQKALAQLNINAKIEHVKDFVQIAKYGVMRTPALVVDEVVKVSGRVATVDEILAILKKTNN
ncbi:MAG: thioredoxin family protein [Bacilli bacterium]